MRLRRCCARVAWAQKQVAASCDKPVACASDPCDPLVTKSPCANDTVRRPSRAAAPASPGVSEALTVTPSGRADACVACVAAQSVSCFSKSCGGKWMWHNAILPEDT